MTGTGGLLLVHAHPDDESIGTGATMARYVAAGVAVTLVTCTRGERGEVIPAELAHLTGDALGEHRTGELAAAMAELGVTDHLFLDQVPGFAPIRFRDSGMAWGPDGRAQAAPDTSPGAFALADPDDAAARLAAVLRDRRPGVVISYDPGGGYGHPDHVRAHRVTARAVELAGRPGPGGPAWSVPKLYWLLTGPAGASAVVDAAGYLDRKVAALRAHATQLTVAERTFALSNDVDQPLSGIEYFQLAAGAAGGPTDGAGRETDLFAGLAPAIALGDGARLSQRSE